MDDFLSIGEIFKATPAEEAGERYVYLEASNEALDQQGEVVLAKALSESADYFLRYGNLDLDHYTQIGARAGIADPHLYEIGRPVTVKLDGSRTLVKGLIYAGEGPVAERANHFWDSITRVIPPQRWYPSVGGAVLAKSNEIDPETKSARTYIQQVRWTNIGMSKTPVNQAVPAVSTVPFGALAKCWGVHGLDLRKALEAGYGTDSAALTGGAALRKQSLHGAPVSYWDFRDRLSGDLLKGVARDQSVAGMVDYAVHQYGLDPAEAAKWVATFIKDLRSHRKGQRKQEKSHVRKAA